MHNENPLFLLLLPVVALALLAGCAGIGEPGETPLPGVSLTPTSTPTASPSATPGALSTLPPVSSYQTAPAGYVYYHQVLADTGGYRDILLEICAPDPANPPASPLPAVAYIHGGGWNHGTVLDGASKTVSYASRGYVGVSLDYRLTSESGDPHSFPAQIEDIKLAIRYLRAHAALYHIDPDRIALWGTSAGAHLAALAGTTGSGAPELEGSGGWGWVSSRVAAVVDWYGPTDLQDPQLETNSSVIALLGGSPSQVPEKARAATPQTWASVDDPPFLIMHGNADTTVPYQHSIALRDTLRTAGVDVTFALVGGAGHGIAGYLLANGVTTDDYAWAFLNFHLKGLGTHPVDAPDPTPTPTPVPTPTPEYSPGSIVPLSQWSFDATSPVVDSQGADNVASSGTAAQLSLASGKNGSAVAMSQSTAGGTGVYYKGQTAPTDRYNLTGGFTWEFLFQCSCDTSKMNTDVVLADFNAGTTGYKLLLKSGTFVPKVNFYLGSSTAASVSAASAVPANTWTLLTVVYNPASAGSEISFYLNGSLDASASMPAAFFANTADQLLLFGGANTAGKDLDGIADHAAVFNRPLTAAEVASRALTLGF